MWWSEISYWALAGVVFGYVGLCPFNKVEESFNTQAMHDAWLLGFGRLEHWDHRTFPGTVPRSFVGALAVAWASAGSWAVCGRFIARWLVQGSCGTTMLARQVWCRCALGSAWLSSLAHLCRGARAKYGDETAAWLCALTASQFHQAFYATRTLPNTLALAPALWAYGDALVGRRLRALLTLVATTVVFRCDLAALVVPLGALWTLDRRDENRLSFFAAATATAAVAAAGVVLSMAVDSVLWGRPVWPEGQVLLFNNPIDNRSARWGVSPRHWYATSALPRSLGVAFPLAVISLLRKPDALVAAAAVSIVLLSFLPHKELRFVFPALPLLNLSAAKFLAADRRALGAACVALNAAATAALFVRAAAANYPGGLALKTLHDLSCPLASSRRDVHIDVAAAVSGASRFGEAFRPHWRYDKTEDVDDPALYAAFDYRLAPVEPRTPGDAASRAFFTTMAVIPAYAGLRLDVAQWPFLHIRSLPHLLVLANNATRL